MRTHHTLRRLRRLPILWWAAVAILALVVGVTVTNTLSRAEAAAARYEGIVRIGIATRDLAPGTVLSNGDVHFEERPGAFLPDSAAVDQPQSRVVAVAVVKGEPLVEAKLGPGGLGPVASMLRANERAIAVGQEAKSLRLSVGDTVDVIGSFGTGTPDGPSALLMATNSRVVDVTGSSVTIAVHETEAPRVALAAGQGNVALTLSSVPH